MAAPKPLGVYEDGEHICFYCGCDMSEKTEDARYICFDVDPYHSQEPEICGVCGVKYECSTYLKTWIHVDYETVIDQ